MHLTLIVPELLWPEPADQIAYADLACPGLAWLLAHGSRRREAASPAEAALAAPFGLPASAPFGALRLLGEGVNVQGPNPRQGFWLCADPVHLRFHHERIVLADAGAFDLSDDEAHALAGDLNRQFPEIGEFYVAQSRRWYLRLHAPESHAAPPLSAVAGRRLERDTAGSRLQNWLNEVQMVLHGHPVNAAREAAGKPAVNSLWLWGAGPLEATANPAFAAVWADDPLALGLARAGGIAAHPRPASLHDWLAENPGGHHLVLLDTLQGPVLYEDSTGWRAALEDLEAAWFTPLRRALGGTVQELTLVAPTVYGLVTWQLAGTDRWKFWRRPQPLATLARELASELAPEPAP